MGRSLLLFAGFALFFGFVFGGYAAVIADRVHQIAELQPPLIPYLRFAFPLVVGAIASAAFLRYSRLARRLPSRFPGRMWMAWGVGLQLVGIPMVIALLLAMETTTVGRFPVAEWMGLPGAVALVVGCGKALLAASPHPAD